MTFALETCPELRTIFLAALITLMVLSGCSPERDNPLDPASEYYAPGGVIMGTVRRLSDINPPIDSARVAIFPAGQAVITRKDGKFRFDGLDPGDYAILSSKPGFQTDTARVRLETNGIHTSDFLLDALPGFRHPQVHTVHIDRFFPGQLYHVQLYVDVFDDDGPGDIRSVVAKAPDVAYVDTMHVTQTIGTYSARITAAELPGLDIKTIIGHNVFFEAQDARGGTAVSGNIVPVRFIYETADAISPRADTTVREVELVWKQPNVRFKFTYTVVLQLVEAGVPVEVWRAEDIPPDSTIARVDPAPAVDGTYHWHVTMTDDFGNWSMSKEAAFRLIRSAPQ